MSFAVKPTAEACGAIVTGLDLTKPIDAESVAALRGAWLEHHVLVFPNQAMSADDLERFTRYFGDFGDDPFFGPIPGREHIAAIRRDADEPVAVFGEAWHTDWSFQERPPAGTCLLGVTIPPHGGDTLFANQHAALDAMPDALRARIEGKQAIHSAKLPYAPGGAFGDADQAAGRSMDIRPSEAALAEQRHPIVRAHPETGRLGIFGTIGYSIGIEGVPQDEASALLRELHEWQTRPEFVYTHAWQPEMLVMWDNRSVLHRATGGYDGYARLLHRTTIAAA